MNALRLLLVTAAVGLALPAQAEDSRDVARTSGSKVLVSSSNACVRTKWSAPGDACGAPKPPVPRQERVVIAKEERTVYFGFNQALLTDESMQKLDSLATKLKSDKQVRQARIVGYADRIGQTAYNEKLSQRRAEAIQRYLTSRGFINTSIAETRWLGESAPVTQCPDNLPRPELIDCLQKDRRVELEIDYLPTQQ